MAGRVNRPCQYLVLDIAFRDLCPDRSYTDPMPEQPGLQLAVALILLVGLAVLASRVGRLGMGRPIVSAAGRAVLQLGVVALIISAVLAGIAWSLLFAGLMFAVAVVTTSRRVGAPRAWPWAALAVGAGVAPVLTVIFGTGTVPFTGASLVPFAGIVIGGAMNAHSLAGRRAFAALREQHGSYEAALSLGFPRSDAIAEVEHRLLPEALVPGLDQTRTVGLVTLPGAFVGVMLGGGSPVQAAAAQVLVLVGLLAAQTITATVAGSLIRAARLLPPDLARSLQP